MNINQEIRVEGMLKENIRTKIFKKQELAVGYQYQGIQGESHEEGVGELGVEHIHSGLGNESRWGWK